MPPAKFHVNWPFGSEEEAKKKFSKWLILAIFDLQVIPSTKFRVNWLFGLGEEVKKISKTAAMATTLDF